MTDENGNWVSYYKTDIVNLDGDFTIEQLQKIIAQMVSK